MFLKTLPEEVLFEYMMRQEFGLRLPEKTIGYVSVRFDRPLPHPVLSLAEPEFGMKYMGKEFFILKEVEQDKFELWSNCVRYPIDKASALLTQEGTRHQVRHILINV